MSDEKPGKGTQADQATEKTKDKKGKKNPKDKNVTKDQKDKKGKKGKKGKSDGDQAEAGAQVGLSVASHPRARGQVRRAKGWGGLMAFAFAAYLSISAGVPPYEAGIRAIAAGVVGFLLAWACSVTIWRHIALAELRVAAEQLSVSRLEGETGEER